MTLLKTVHRLFNTHVPLLLKHFRISVEMFLFQEMFIWKKNEYVIKKEKEGKIKAAYAKLYVKLHINQTANAHVVVEHTCCEVKVTS